MKNFVMVPEAELAALQKERDELRAEVAKKDEALQKERDAFLWAEKKRENARSANHAALLADGDAAREALREICDRVDDATDEHPTLPVLVFRDGYEIDANYTADLRKRGGIA